MKILEVNKYYYPIIGGIETTLRQITQGLANDFELSVVCCPKKGPSSVEKIDGAVIHRASSIGVFWGMPISFSFFGMFKKLSKKNDLIVFHYPFPLADVAYYFFRPKAPLVVHYHCDIYRQRLIMPIINIFVKNTLKRAKSIIIESPNILKTSTMLQSYKDKCIVVNCGIEENRFENYSQSKVIEIVKEYGEFVLFVGRLSPYKGVEYLVRAMAGLNKKLVIIGDGEDKEKLVNLSHELNLQNQVIFLSHLSFEELNAFYLACYTLVLPSIYRSEALGLVLLEAMYAGKPVISTELGTGTSYVNQDGITGFVVPPMNDRAIHEALNRLFADKNLYNSLSKSASARVKNEFLIKDMIRKTMKVYTS